MSIVKQAPPKTLDELLSRANALQGASLASLAERYLGITNIDVKRAKGILGELLEKVLGASAGSKPLPDFTDLGVELKTIPVDKNGKPKESTFVTSIPLLTIHKQRWLTSTVYQKLKCVLWIPILSEPGLSLQERVISKPILWQPTAEQLNVLQEDWEELVDMIAMGELEQISAKLGEYLQVRPKGANAKSLTDGINARGEKIKTLPRGFYLRAGFTAQILLAKNSGF